MPRKDPAEIKFAFGNEYERRGRPLEYTAWDPATLMRYMRWKLHTASAGADIGGYRHLLPQGSAGRPARLPQEVLDWEAGLGARPAPPAPATTTTTSAPAEVEEVPEYKLDDKYALDFVEADGKNVLKHLPTGHELELDPLAGGGRYKFYASDDGSFCIFNGTNAEYCADVFATAAAAEDEYKRRQARNQARPTPLTGMVKAGEPAKTSLVALPSATAAKALLQFKL